MFQAIDAQYVEKGVHVSKCTCVRNEIWTAFLVLRAAVLELGGRK